MSKFVSVNSRNYRRPTQPVLAVCVDESEPDYIVKAVGAGVMPCSEKLSTAAVAICASSA